jgi:hypothetical protein
VLADFGGGDRGGARLCDVHGRVMTEERIGATLYILAAAIALGSVIWLALS